MKITPAVLNRVYVTDPRDWAYRLGTDYIWAPSAATALNTGGTAGQVLSEFGWTTTSVLTATPSAADFMASGDTGVHNGIGTNATGDLLVSPFIFGDYAHALAVGDLLGYQPTKLTLDVLGSFTDASANEPRSVFGLLEAGADGTLAASAAAAFGSDATNFRSRNGSLTNFTGGGSGIAVDNAFHRWTITVTGTDTEFFIDGASLGTLTITGTEQDIWPVGFYMHSLTTNRMFLSKIHVHYR